MKSGTLRREIISFFITMASFTVSWLDNSDCSLSASHTELSYENINKHLEVKLQENISHLNNDMFPTLNCTCSPVFQDSLAQAKISCIKWATQLNYEVILVEWFLGPIQSHNKLSEIFTSQVSLLYSWSWLPQLYFPNKLASRLSTQI